MKDESANNKHYNDVTMSAMASQITGVSIVWSTVRSDAAQRKHQRSTSLAFVVWIYHQWLGKCFHSMTPPLKLKGWRHPDIALLSIVFFNGCNAICIMLECGEPVWYYKNWYQYWGHGGLINDLGSSPQHEGEPEWPTLWYQSLLYYDETKWMMNKRML